MAEQLFDPEGGPRMTEAQAALYLESMPIAQLSPGDRRAALERLARRAVAIVGSDRRRYHDVVQSLADAEKVPSSEASMAVLYSVDEGYLKDEGVPSMLSQPDQPAITS